MRRDPQDRPGGVPVPKVTMPQLGESVAEGTIGKWLKNIGDHVDKYEPIVEVVTDKTRQTLDDFMIWETSGAADPSQAQP